MMWCPKFEEWIFREECDYDESCWELENWDTCQILKRKILEAEKERRR